MWILAHRRIVIVLFAMVFMWSSSLKGQEKKDQAKEPPKDKPTVLDFWQLDAGLGTQAAAHIIGAGNVFGALGARMLATDDRAALDSWRFVFDEPLPIYHRYLEAIRDKRPLPDIRIELGKQIRKLPEWERAGSPDWGWYNAFSDALRRSDEADLDMFKKAADRNKNVLYPHLKSTPEQFRGKIITVTGKLTVIREEPTPRKLRDTVDRIERIYTGYIIGPTKGAPPFAVAFTELPERVTPSENLSLEVTFHGYFLSLVRFPPDKKQGKKQEDIISPYLVGKTLILVPPVKTPAETAYTSYVLVAAVGGLLMIAILVAALNLWFRSGDRRIQSQLAAMREKNQPFNLEPAEAEPGPEAETPAPSAMQDPQTGIQPAQMPNDANPPPAN